MKRFMPLAWYRGNIMQQTVKASRTRVWLNKLKTTFSKPQNAILLALGILLVTSIMRMWTLFCRRTRRTSAQRR